MNVLAWAAEPASAIGSGAQPATSTTASAIAEVAAIVVDIVMPPKIDLAMLVQRSPRVNPTIKGGCGTRWAPTTSSAPTPLLAASVPGLRCRKHFYNRHLTIRKQAADECRCTRTQP